MSAQDPFDEARPGWVKLDDLIGRLLLIKAEDVGERESTMKGQLGKTYQYVETTTVVLSGDTTDLITEIPHKLEAFQFQGTRVVNTLKPKLKTGRLVLGKLIQVPSKQGMDAWDLEAPSDKDKEVARSYIESQKDDPFDS